VIIFKLFKLSVKLIGYQFFTFKSLALALLRKLKAKPLTFAFRSSHTKITRFLVLTTKDRNQTGSHRFEPNSRNALLNEQLNH